MIFKILEPYPEINPTYLSYLKEQWHEIILYDEIIEKEKVDWIIIRSKIKVDSDLVDEYLNLKYVFRVWVWIENIDKDLLKGKNIVLKNTPWANSQSVAELCLWAILWLLRNTNKSFISLGDRYNFMWSELSNKTIWIIWFWNIWKILYKLINVFWENNFLIYDPFLNPEDFKEKNISFTNDKKDIFKNSDIISFHIPLLPTTKNFLDKDDFKLLKTNVKIINSSRWWIIDENSLIEFLNCNSNSGAFLDTWEEEPLNPKKELMSLQNCIITPHIGAMTEESNKKMHIFNI